jgi:hypothetical protein
VTGKTLATTRSDISLRATFVPRVKPRLASRTRSGTPFVSDDHNAIVFHDVCRGQINDDPSHSR